MPLEYPATDPAWSACLPGNESVPGAGDGTEPGAASGARMLRISPVLVQAHSALREGAGTDRFFSNPAHLGIEQDYFVSGARAVATATFSPVRLNGEQAAYVGQSELLNDEVPGLGAAVLAISVQESLSHHVARLAPSLGIVRVDPADVTLVHMRNCVILRAPYLHLEAEEICRDDGLFGVSPEKQCRDRGVRSRFCTVLVPWGDTAHEKLRIRTGVMRDLALYGRWLAALISPLENRITLGEPDFGETGP